MGFVNAVKGIIAKSGTAGKSENEISDIIENATEKAAVNRGHLKKDEFSKPENKVVSSMEVFKRAISEMGITAEQAKEAICKMSKIKGREERENSNNWRKMHGLPMRRKQKVRKRNER